MSKNSELNNYLPMTTGSDFGFAMALVEVIRILTAIDRKMYVLIKKTEDLNSTEKIQSPTTYAEDMGYQEDDEPEAHDLNDK